MHNIIYNNSAKLSFKALICGLILAILITTAGFLLIKPQNQEIQQISKELLDIQIPIEYTEPLIIAAFNNIFSIKPIHANNSQAITQGENIIKYIDAYPNTDVVQTKYSDKIKEDIVLKKPGHPDKFEYQINIENYEFEKDSEGNMHFYEKGYKNEDLYKLFTIPAPYLIDAQGEKSPISEVEFSLNRDGLLTLKPKARWLDAHTYPIILDPTVEINVLNVHSHPQQGEEWVVEFTTSGRADLKIIPADQATINDDEFVGLYCGDKKIKPKILEDDVIYYKDWQCNSVATVIHYTQIAGKHHLIFDFGGQQAGAFNDPGDTWWDTDWSYRKEITIDNTANSNTLTDFQVFVEIDNTHTNFWTNVDPDGDDVRFTDQNGTVEYDYYAVYWNTTTDEVVVNEATYWVQMDSIAANSNVPLYMYYGNSGAAATSSAEETFSYGTPEERFVLMGDYNDGGSYMMSFFDNNRFGVNNNTSSDEFNTAYRSSLTSSHLDELGAVASSTKPIAISGRVASSDMWVPFAWQATSTITGNYLANPEIEIYNVGESTAQVNVLEDGALDTALEISANSISDAVYTMGSNGNVIVTSTQPVLLYLEGGSGRVVAGLPAEKEWWGHDRYTRVLGTVNSTLAEVYYSDNGAMVSSSLNRGGVWAASNGDKWAVTAAYVSSTEPVFAYASADGSGSDSQIFYPKRELDKVHISPDDYEYMACSTPYATTTVELYTVSGGAWSQVDLGANTSFTRTGDDPNPWWWKDANARSGGVKIVTNNPVYCYVDRDVTSDESNIPNIVINRKGTWPRPSVSSIGSEEEAPAENNTPTISTVNDTPDPVTVGSDITFSVDWNDDDAGENIKAKICKTDNLTNQNCDDGFWATSTSFTTDYPEEITYTSQTEDIATSPNNYYAFVCDDGGECSSSSSGTFTVQAVPAAEDVKGHLKSGTIKVQGGSIKLNKKSEKNLISYVKLEYFKFEEMVRELKTEDEKI